MPAAIIDGRALGSAIRDEVGMRARSLRERGVHPKCAAIVADGDAAGLLYAQTAKRAGAEHSIEVEIVPVGADADTSGAIAIVARIVEEPTVHGVIIQRPLPAKVDAARVLNALDPRKDVDCAHPYSIGLLASGHSRFAPATAVAVMELLGRSPGRALAGARVAVLGRSTVVGRPVAMLLTGANATVTICHSKTERLAEVTREADIIVAAVGKANFVTADMVTPGATVIDVGTNVIDGRLIGDVDPSVNAVAGAITLVPGGVGPVTTAVLLRNIVSAAESVSP